MYPLAWGKKQVRADAFLTGLLHFSEDLSTARVCLQLIDAKNPKQLETLWWFDTETTLNTLTDMGLDFSVRPLADDAPPKAKKQSGIGRANISKAMLTGLLPPEPPTNLPDNPVDWWAVRAAIVR